VHSRVDKSDAASCKLHNPSVAIIEGSPALASANANLSSVSSC